MDKPVTPLLTVDIIVELTDRPENPIVLIERRYPPYGWALPGGFVDVGETLEQAAVREAEEEISLVVSLKSLLGCYSDPARDKRGHTVSAVYVAEATGSPIAADDASRLKSSLNFFFFGFYSNVFVYLFLALEIVVGSLYIRVL